MYVYLRYSRCVTNYRVKSFWKCCDATLDSAGLWSVRSPRWWTDFLLFVAIRRPVVARYSLYRDKIFDAISGYGCTCNRCAILAPVLSPYQRIFFFYHFICGSTVTKSVQLNSCTVKRDRVSFNFELNNVLICNSYFEKLKEILNMSDMNTIFFQG